MDARAVKQFVKGNRPAYLLLSPLIRLRRWMAARRYERLDRTYDSIFERVEDGSLVVSIPQFRGAFEIDSHSHSLKRALLHTIDGPERVDLAARHVSPNRDVLDIGASVGLYTVVFSKMLSAGCKVLAVEPTPRSIHYLRRNIERNGCKDSVIVFEGLASDAGGDYRLNVIEGMEEYSSMGEMVHPSIRGKPFRPIEVRGETIDDLVDRFRLAPGLIKVDAEGAEYLVLSGAARTLRTHRPVVLSELSELLLGTFGHTSRMVIDLLEEAGYGVSDALEPATPAVAPFEGDILAVPRADGPGPPA